MNPKDNGTGSQQGRKNTRSRQSGQIAFLTFEECNTTDSPEVKLAQWPDDGRRLMEPVAKGEQLDRIFFRP